MAVQSEVVAHADLVGGAETPLHSHAGGGGGPTVKSGTATSDGSGQGSVSFSTAFSDTNYAVSMIALGTADSVFCTCENKTASGFDFYTFNDRGQSVSSVTVEWIAVAYYDP